MKAGFAWHRYHSPYLLHWVTDWDDFNSRVETIKINKPRHEQSQRLRWFKMVRGKLPAELSKACEAWRKAEEALNKACEPLGNHKAWDFARKTSEKACEEWRLAYARHLPEIEALHAKECPNCTWQRDTRRLSFLEEK